MMKRGRPQHTPTPSHHRMESISLSASPEPTRRGSPGNNKFGARGTLKCLNCRNRKAKCEFNTKDDDCRWCAQRGLSCGEKLLGEKHQIREHRRQLGIGNTPLSTIALQLEHAYPRATPWEISEMAREALILAGESDGQAIENISCDGKSLSPPRVDRGDSVKIENSPKTPPLSLQAGTFLSASERTAAPTPVQHSNEPRTTLLLAEPIPTYNYTHQFAMPTRDHYDARQHASYNPNYYAERIVDTSPWAMHVTWQETM